MEIIKDIKLRRMPIVRYFISIMNKCFIVTDDKNSNFYVFNGGDGDYDQEDFTNGVILFELDKDNNSFLISERFLWDCFDKKYIIDDKLIEDSLNILLSYLCVSLDSNVVEVTIKPNDEYDDGDAYMYGADDEYYPVKLPNYWSIIEEKNNHWGFWDGFDHRD